MTAEFPQQPPSGRLKLDVLCAGDGEAAALTKAAQAYWDGKRTVLAGFAFLVSLQDPALGSLLGDISGSLVIESRKPRVTVSVQIAEKTLEKLKNGPKK